MFAAQAIGRDMTATGRGDEVEQIRHNIATVVPGLSDASANPGPEQNQLPYLLGSTKIRGVKRRDRLPSEGRASVRGRRLDVQPSMSATLTPRILVLPIKSGGGSVRRCSSVAALAGARSGIPLRAEGRGPTAHARQWADDEVRADPSDCAEAIPSRRDAGDHAHRPPGTLDARSPGHCRDTQTRLRQYLRKYGGPDPTKSIR